MKRKIAIIEGPHIKIVGPMTPAGIVKVVVNTFIDFEHDKKGKGVVFKYPVEELTSGENLYIIRPGKKWNFDFKVDVKPDYMLEKATHDQIALILRHLKEKEDEEFYKLWHALTEIYDCTECDVSIILKKDTISISERPQLDILLKVIKWLFIMEDILYWHFEGRAFLYNSFSYSVSETDINKFSEIFKRIKDRKLKPEGLKKLMQEMNMAWRLPKNY